MPQHSTGTINLLRSQSFQKTNISHPLIRTRTFAYQRVKIVSFSENLANVIHELCLFKNSHIIKILAAAFSLNEYFGWR